jgi:hypothetical protein
LFDMLTRLAPLALLATIFVVQAATATAGTSAPCWQRLVRDWSDGRVDGAYPVGCYRAALRNLPQDLRIYSSAPDDIRAALQKKLSRSSANAERRRLSVAGKARTGQAPVLAGNRTSLDRPTVLAAALGAFGVVMAMVALIGALGRRRRSR